MEPAFLPAPTANDMMDDTNHFSRTNTQRNPERTNLQSWISLKLSPQTLLLFSPSIVLAFREKIGIIYCCQCRAHCPPLSQGQSCHDIELIRACFSFVSGGRKQIRGSGVWRQGGDKPQAKPTTARVQKTNRKRNPSGKWCWFLQKCQEYIEDFSSLAGWRETKTFPRNYAHILLKDFYKI